MASFSEYSRYYDIFNDGKDYRSEVRYITEKLTRHHTNSSVNKILEIGCGSGGHAIELARLGYSITGVDPSESMLKEAEAKVAKAGPDVAERIQLFQASAVSIDFPHKFDAALALFHVVRYINSDAELEMSFNAIGNHLDPGATFIFDFWYGPAVLTDRPAIRVRRRSKDGMEFVRIAEPDLRINENIVDVNYDISISDRSRNVEKFHEKHSMRYYFLPEIKAALRRTGFEFLECFEYLTDALPDDRTWNVIVSARRR